MFLREAGSEQFAYWPGEQVQLGAEVVNLGTSAQEVEVRMTVRDARGTVLWTQTAMLAVPPSENRRWEQLTTPAGTQPATCQVTTELLRQGIVVDRIDHDFQVLDTRTPAKAEFMTVRGSNFYLGDQPWNPVGVNYWPLYVSGMQHDDFWAGWLQQRYYDPALVDQDLQRMTAIGINLVSIQSPDPKFYRNLLDFLCRCRQHGVYVNLFCGLASPLAFRENELKDFIATARLADNPTIMAYDTIWEPGNYVFQGDRRAGWDEQWRGWVIEQYGSIDGGGSRSGRCPASQGRARTPDFATRRVLSRRWLVAHDDGCLPAVHG